MEESSLIVSPAEAAAEARGETPAEGLPDERALRVATFFAGAIAKHVDDEIKAYCARHKIPASEVSLMGYTKKGATMRLVLEHKKGEIPILGTPKREFEISLKTK